MDLSDKIQRVRQTADERRPIASAESPWMPSADSKIYRVFKWWKNETGYASDRPGFCLFFWAVVLFAPLLYIGQKLAKPMRSAVVWTGVGLAVFSGIEALASWGGLWALPLIIAGGALAILGFAFGIYMRAEDEFGLFTDAVRNVAHPSELTIGMCMALVLAPVALVGYAVASVIAWIANLDWIETFFAVVVGILFTVMVIGLLITVYCGFHFGMHLNIWQAILCVVGSVLAFAALMGAIFGIAIGLAKVSEMRREHRYSRAREESKRVSDEIVQMKPADPNTLQRLLASVIAPFVSVATTVWQLCRLVYEAVRYIKVLKTCPLVEIPEDEPELLAA